ncbi:MAG: AIR synthase-related protein [Butyrivibrio sp.]|nr:AIR synthase-related protein [Acetatifactor muris]MCM1559352.1 AIR synthase-related protein [Butyrivibrio sp.]
MKIGKVPENVLKRSVLRQLQTKREEIISGAGIGEDCAIFSFDGGIMMTCMQTAAVKCSGFHSPEKPEISMAHLLQRCANNLAAAGAQPVGAAIALTLPEDAEEADVKALMADAEAKCRELHMQIAGGQTRVSGAVRQPVAAVTGYGKPFEPENETVRQGKSSEKPGRPGKYPASAVQAGQHIVISKWIGLEGTAMLAGRYRDKLLKRYPAYFVEEAAGFDRLLSVIPEAATAMKSGACMMHDASEGGIFGALWELAERAGVGLTIDLKKLPLRQETVEVCEYCNVNPYELLSGGALIMVTEDGPGLLEALKAENIPAAIVGRTTDSNDRIIRNGEETRFLDRPKSDEINKE